MIEEYDAVALKVATWIQFAYAAAHNAKTSSREKLELFHFADDMRKVGVRLARYREGAKWLSEALERE